MSIFVNRPRSRASSLGYASAGRAEARRAFLLRVGLALTLLLAVGLRFYRLAGQSLWADEGNSVALARASLDEIAARTALDIHPPLYYWLLHGWMRIFGDSEVAVRSLSAVVGVLLVAVVYRLGDRLYGRTAGLLAAFIASVSPFQVYYAQETRMYMLLAFLGALLVWATLELMSNHLTSNAEAELVQAKAPYSLRSIHAKRAIRSARYSLLYLLSATLGLYTHYAFPVVLLAANAAFLAHLWQSCRRGGAARRWLALQLIPLALFLPWLPVAWRQLTTWPAPPAAWVGGALITTARTLVLGPVAGVGANPWLLGFGLLGLLGILYLVTQQKLPIALLMLLYLGLPIGLTLALFKPAYFKFLLVASPALCLLLAAGVKGVTHFCKAPPPAPAAPFACTCGAGTGGPGKRSGEGAERKRVAPRGWAGWLAAGLVALAAWGPLAAYYTDPSLARDDYRGMARYLEAVAGPQDAVVLDAAGQQEVFGYYYRGDTPVYPLPRRRPLDPQSTLAELEALLARSRRVYALYWATDESDPAGVIEGWLETNAFKATEAWVGNVRLVSYAAPLPAGDLTPAAYRLGDQVTLTGFRLLASRSSLAGQENGSRADQPASLASPRTVPGEIVQVQLRWATGAPLDTHYNVFLQALDEANHLAGQRDAEPAVPTLDWQPGQPVLDRHGLLIEPGTPPGQYRAIVGLYDVVTGQRLPTGSGDFITLGTVLVERPAAPPPVAALRFRHPAHADFGPLRLLGYDRYKLGHSYDSDTPLRPGDPLHVVLYWQAQSHPGRAWQLVLRLARLGDSGSPAAEQIFPAAGMDYPTTRWEPGEVVRAQFDLFVPGNAQPGEYQVSLRLLSGEDSREADAFNLLPISVQP